MHVTAVEAEIRYHELAFEVCHQKQAEHQRTEAAELCPIILARIVERGLKEKLVGLHRTLRSTGDTSISFTASSASLVASSSRARSSASNVPRIWSL